MVKYRPPGNRTPTEEEVSRSMPYLREEFRLLRKPPVIVTVGSTSTMAVYRSIPDLPKRSVSNLVGKVIQLDRRTSLIAMFHPSYALRLPADSPMQGKIDNYWWNLGKWIRGNGLL
jgi:DNA polymerase